MAMQRTVQEKEKRALHLEERVAMTEARRPHGHPPTSPAKSTVLRVPAVPS